MYFKFLFLLQLGLQAMTMDSFTDLQVICFFIMIIIKESLYDIQSNIYC